LQRVNQLESECALLKSQLEKKEQEVNHLNEICEQLRKDLEAKQPKRVCPVIVCQQYIITNRIEDLCRIKT